MSWRVVVISSRAKLEYKLGYLVIRYTDDVRKVFLPDISVLIIENTGCTLTTALLQKLWEEKICIIFCDEKRNPGAQLLPYYGSHDTSLKIENQTEWSEKIKAEIWATIIKEKIYRQSKCLEQFDKKGSEKIYEYIMEVEEGDVTNREGHAAKVYFNALFGMDFSREQDNYINAALNYGYSVILSAINREIVANGYITQIGIFHKNRFNEFNLGCDIMEPIRPLIDNFVAKCPVEEELTSNRKMEIVNLLNSDVWISGMRTSLLNSLNIYVKSVLDSLTKREPVLIRFIEYEF